MIPIVSLISFTFFIFSAAASIKLFHSYRKTRDKRIGYFLGFFFFLTIVLLLDSTPGIFFKDLYTLGLIFNVYPFLGAVAMIYLVSIPLEFLGWQKFRKIFSVVILSSMFALTVFNVVTLQPAVVHNLDPFIVWEDTRGVAANIAMGLIFFAITLAVVFFFLYYGRKSKEKYIHNRSLMIVAGLTLLGISGILNFSVGASPEVFIPSLIAGIFGLLGLILLLASVYYKYKPSTYYYKSGPKETP